MEAAARAARLAQYASLFARAALKNIRREYPNKPEHVLYQPADLHSPRELHPVFYGSFDWHSSVHMHWSLVRLLRQGAAPREQESIADALNEAFTVQNVAAEVAYLRQPGRQSFERPYGWAWLLKLQTELIALATAWPSAAPWRDALKPLAEVVVEYYQAFLPVAQYPVRAGTHANSAFSLLFALDYAECTQHLALKKLLAAKANAWFGRDRLYPAGYEPGGDDFLSAGLLEAALMLRVVDGCSYADWWSLFCPAPQELQTWLLPVEVADRSDPKLAHLDGVNLARAWCWKSISIELPLALHSRVGEAIDAHLAASIPHSVQGDYAGTHWLASFALLALTDG